MTMTKADIVNAVYERMSAEDSPVTLTKRETREYVEKVLETMKEALESKEDIKVSGFGKFEVRAKGERVGRNPRTKVEIKIPARHVLRFKVSQVLKDRLNGKR